MFDIDIVRENYASMMDEKLLHIATTEGAELTDEALVVLKEEFSRRGMDQSVFSTIEETKKASKEESFPAEQEIIPHEFTNSIWGYAYEEKILAKSNEEITSGLLEHGLNEEEAGSVVANIGINARLLLQKSNKEMEKYGIILGIGIAVTIITFLLAEQRGGTYIVAWGAVLFGGIRFFRAFDTRARCRSILRNIDSEKGFTQRRKEERKGATPGSS
jgi:hypothetical protein